ncbi:MAG: tetratricopeptide repeat protein, partial [Egibacteraceae bacterium]
ARYDEASERYEQALPIYRQIGDRLGEANTLVSRGRLAIASGQRARAVSEMTEAIRIYRSIGLNQWVEVFQAEAADWDDIVSE